MKRTHLVGALATAAILISGCIGGGDGGASSEDYDAVRAGVGSSIGMDSGSDSAVDIPDGEIDCMAKARDESVADFAKELNENDGDNISDDEAAKIIGCLSGDSFRSTIGASMASGDDVSSSGADEDCVLDLLVDQFDKWKEDGATTDGVDNMFGEDMMAAAASCGGTTEEDYTKAREALQTAMEEDSGISADFTNDEIDCMAEARDGSVADLTKEITESEGDTLDDDESAEILGCLSTETFRAMMASAFEGEGLAEAGIDEDCVLDLMADQFDEWKDSGASADNLDVFEAEDLESEILGCITNS